MQLHPNLSAAPVATFRSRTQDELVWKILFDRQTALLHRRAVAPLAEGVRALGLERSRLPDLAALDRRLFRLTGWHLEVAPGRLPDAAYLGLLAQRRLPVNATLRTPAEFEFVPGPDLFHDVFGHLPLLVAEPLWVRFLEGVGRLAQRRARDPRAIRALTRLYWHTAEFGLLREADGGVRALGAGLLSSTAELHFALSKEAASAPFQLAAALEMAPVRTAYQPAYFVLPGWDALPGVIADAAAVLAEAPQLQPVRRTERVIV